MSSSIYQPLAVDGKAVRLLTILPGQAQEHISCLIKHSRLDDEPAPRYETVSYCWGDALDRETITINGVELSVPASSAAVISRIRLLQEARTIWIDAICIDQGNIEERNRQVPLVGHIYSKGFRNLVYLGEDDMTEAFASIRSILEDPSSKETLELVPNLWVKSPMPLAIRNTIGVSYDEPALTRLFSNDWFWRVWTLQEAVVSKENVCISGGSQVALQEIIQACQILYYNLRFISLELLKTVSAPTELGSMIDFYHNRGPALGRHLPSRLTPGMLRKCSLPVDRIYGLLHIFPIEGLVPDYRKAPVEVFKETVKLIAATEQNLKIFDIVAFVPHLDSAKRSDVPSWIPHWHEQISIEGFSVPQLEIYGACGGRKYEPVAVLVDEPDDINLLKVKGFQLGRITKVLPYNRWADNTSDDDVSQSGTSLPLQSFLSRLQGLIAEATKERSDYFGEEESVLAQLLVNGIYESGDALLADYRAYKGVVDAGREREIRNRDDGTIGWIDTSLDEDRDGSSLTNEERVVRFHLETNHLCYNRAFFLTDTGYVGNGPKSTQEGDAVAILYGSGQSHVLRLVDNEQYRLQGGSYIHGIMNGEAMKRHEESGSLDRIFALC